MRQYYLIHVTAYEIDQNKTRYLFVLNVNGRS